MNRCGFKRFLFASGACHVTACDLAAFTVDIPDRSIFGRAR
jgi:hypothetical protein